MSLGGTHSMRFALFDALVVKAHVPKNCWRFQQKSYHDSYTRKVFHRSYNKTYQNALESIIVTMQLKLYWLYYIKIQVILRIIDKK